MTAQRSAWTRRSRWAAIFRLGVVPLLGVVLAAGTDPTRERAVVLYDEGRYDEARGALEALDSQGKADGPLLYRLFFCIRSGGDSAGARRALERAVLVLEKEDAASGRLETSFYLANAYANLGRSGDARTVAARATQKIESGEWPAPTRAIEIFQVGKLYQDQARAPEATRWYQKALDAFLGQGQLYTSNVRWARRYLAETAFAAADFAAAAREYGALVAAGGGDRDDYRALALARTRVGSWGSAADAWEEVVRLDPANGDDARYTARLARLAEETGFVPKISPTARPWGRLSKEELETVMAEQAKIVHEIRDQVTSTEATFAPDAKKEMEGRMASARGFFLGAGLEYAARGLPIRETAFSAGYAKLLFRPEEWELP